MTYERILLTCPCKAIDDVPEIFKVLLKNNMLNDLYLDLVKRTYELCGDDIWSQEAVEETLKVFEDNCIPFDVEYEPRSEYHSDLRFLKYRLDENIHKLCSFVQPAVSDIVCDIDNVLSSESLSDVDKLSQIVKINYEGHMRHLETLGNWNKRINLNEYKKDVKRWKILNKIE